MSATGRASNTIADKLDRGMTPGPTTLRVDLLTVVSVGVVVHAATAVLHEGLGHGGACLFVCGTPLRLTSASFDCHIDPTRVIAGNIVAAGGTIVNLIAGAIALWFFKRSTDHGAGRFALWLFAATNIMVGFGYFFYSGISNIGDWADVIGHENAKLVWRALMGAGGFAVYIWATVRLYRLFGEILRGTTAERYRLANKLSIVSFIAGVLLACAAGVFNPGGFLILLISAAAASLGGTSGLAWGAQTLRGATGFNDRPPLTIPRNTPLIATAVAVALLFVFVLGPGMSL